MVLVIITASIFIYFDVQKDKADREVKALLNDLTEAVNLMELLKDEMPGELLEVHQFLVSQIQKGEFKLYQTDPRLPDQVMYHGAKTNSIYINPSIKLKKELWIPIFYHEVAHNYWHSKNPVKTFEEFQEQLFDSEVHSYTVDAQAWNLVMRYYPIKREALKTELEQRLFKIYSNEAEIYNKMIKGNSEATELWSTIIEADIKEQKKYQQLLFEE